MRIGTVIIGDELLSGKRQDKHLSAVIGALRRRGLSLSWAHYLGDEPSDIVACLQASMATPDLVFSFGGIGATADDHTRACAAQAAGLAYARHPEAEAEIVAQFGAEAYPKRVLMADLPVGCTLIPNPVNRIPGFSVAHHHFLPGFPEMAWPMLDWVLDQHYPHLHNAHPDQEQVFYAQTRESALIDAMNQTVAAFPQARLSSLPNLRSGWIELSVRGQPEVVATALQHWQQALREQGIVLSEQPPAAAAESLNRDA